MGGDCNDPKYPTSFRGVLVTPAKNKTVRLCAKADNILLGLGPSRYINNNQEQISDIVLEANQDHQDNVEELPKKQTQQPQEKVP